MKTGDQSRQRIQCGSFSNSPAALYRTLGSKNMHGFLSRIQDSSSPLAWIGLLGITTWKHQEKQRRHEIWRLLIFLEPEWSLCFTYYKPWALGHLFHFWGQFHTAIKFIARQIVSYYITKVICIVTSHFTINSNWDLFAVKINLSSLWNRHLKPSQLPGE